MLEDLWSLENPYYAQLVGATNVRTLSIIGCDVKFSGLISMGLETLSLQDHVRLGTILKTGGSAHKIPKELFQGLYVCMYIILGIISYISKI